MLYFSHGRICALLSKGYLRRYSLRDAVFKKEPWLRNGAFIGQDGQKIYMYTDALSSKGFFLKEISEI